jgi:hypothetical protein
LICHKIYVTVTVLERVADTLDVAGAKSERHIIMRNLNAATAYYYFYFFFNNEKKRFAV